MFDFKLVSIWSLKKPNSSYVDFHSHDYHELVYYVSGEGKTTIGDDIYNFEEGCFTILPPMLPHDELHTNDSEVIVLKFQSSYDFPTALTFNMDTDFKVHRILKKLLSETKEQKFGYKNMIASQLTELCIHILRKENTKAVEKNFEYVINYIKESYTEKINFRDCAAKLNLSYDYFQHKFKKITGYSPQQFLINQRLIASKELLKSKNVSCTDVAFMCGFSTSAQFSAFFKREFGISPSQYQKSHKAKEATNVV